MRHILMSVCLLVLTGGLALGCGPKPYCDAYKSCCDLAASAGAEVLMCDKVPSDDKACSNGMILVNSGVLKTEDKNLISMCQKAWSEAADLAE